jgi:hypothetical protein
MERREVGREKEERRESKSKPKPRERKERRNGIFWCLFQINIFPCAITFLPLP